MDKIKVHKDQLLAAVKKNRETHHTIYLEAFENYKKQATAELETMLGEARQGKTIRRAVSLPAPMDMTKHYDRVIKMLEMETRLEIELDEATFAQYVMDDWTWKHNFLLSNSTYSKTASDMLFTA